MASKEDMIKEVKKNSKKLVDIVIPELYKDYSWTNVRSHLRMSRRMLRDVKEDKEQFMEEFKDALL